MADRGTRPPEPKDGAAKPTKALPETPPADAAALPDRPLRGANAGVGTGRPTEDDLLGRPPQDGWNSNT